MIQRVVNAVAWRLGYQQRNERLELLESNQYNWIRELTIDAIFDVGANDGAFARKISQILPSIELHCFEAIPHIAEGLKNEFKAHSHCHVIDKALSNFTGKTDFFVCENYTGSSSLLEMTDIHKKAYPFTSESKRIEVETLTLDEYYAGLTESKQNILLKIDVQGAEKLVLEGASNVLLSTALIWIEVNFVETYKGCVLFNELNSMLEEKGFYLYGMENISRELHSGSFLQADAFFLSKKMKND